MRNLKILFILGLIVVLLTGCSNKSINPIKVTPNSNTPVIESDKGIEYEVSAESIKEYSFDDVANESMYIAVGIAGKSTLWEQDSGNYYETIFTISDLLKGKIDEKDIYLYTDSNILQEGKNYLLFLEGSVVNGFPNITYRIFNTTYVELDEKDGKMFFNSSPVENYETQKGEKLKSSSEISKYINDNYKDKGAEPLKMPKTKKISSETISEYISESDVIVKMKIKDILVKGRYNHVANIEPIEYLKGNELTNLGLILPSSLEANGIYILFMKNINGAYELIDINGYIKDDDKALKDLLKNKLENK